MRHIKEPLGPSRHRSLIEAGIESVCYIRCMAHCAVPQMNSKENGYGECGTCAVLGERQRIQDAVRVLPVIVGGRFQRFKTLDELTNDILRIVGS